MKKLDHPVVEFSLTHLGKVRTSLYELEPGLCVVVRQPQARALLKKTTVDLEITDEWSQAGMFAPLLQVVPIPYTIEASELMVDKLNKGEAARFRWCHYYPDSRGNVVVQVNTDDRVVLPRKAFDQVLKAVQTISPTNDALAPDQKGQVQ